MDPKPFFKSRTFWLNAATLVVAILTALSNQELILEHPDAALWIAAAVAVGNVVLRFVTDTPIKLLIFLWMSLPFQPFWPATLEAG